MVSEFPPAGIIGLGLSVSTILLEIVLGDGPDDFVDVLPGFKLKCKETPQVLFTLADIQGEADFHLLNLDKLFIGPVSLKRLRFTPVSSHLIKPLSSLASNLIKG